MPQFIETKMRRHRSKGKYRWIRKGNMVTDYVVILKYFRIRQGEMYESCNQTRNALMSEYGKQ